MLHYIQQLVTNFVCHLVLNFSFYVCVQTKCEEISDSAIEYKIYSPRAVKAEPKIHLLKLKMFLTKNSYLDLHESNFFFQGEGERL